MYSGDTEDRFEKRVEYADPLYPRPGEEERIKKIWEDNHKYSYIYQQIVGGKEKDEKL